MAKWIWQNNRAKKNEHADFFTRFFYKKEYGATILRVSVDSEYGLFVNGELLSFGQYPDYPHYKVYEEIDITPYLKDGDNALAIEAWYFGANTSTYIQGNAGLWFELSCGEKVLCESNEDVLARLSKTYYSHQEKTITPQIGYSYSYDAIQEDNWKIQGGKDFLASVSVDRQAPIIKRPIHRLETKMGRAGARIKAEKGRILFDFGEELVGIFRLRFSSSILQNIKICWGEHIVDGWVRDVIDNRDFSIDYRAKTGKNDYLGYFRRLGLRYMEIRYEEEVDELQVEILSREYPLTEIPFDCKDEALQRIYNACVKTLKLCLHDHYEDCPWREQALYAMDSRNQMLCGYYAFKEYDFSRACLKLMSEDRRTDGLFSICFPAGIDLTIPSFGLHYFTEVREYADHSGDWAFIKEIFPKLNTLLLAYERCRTDNGLLPTFEGDNYWNFYEWAEGLEGTLHSSESQKTDLVLNCLYSIALQHIAYMCERLGKENEYQARALTINQIIRDRFFDAQENAYTMYENTQNFSELGNALAILCGVATPTQAKSICEKLVGEHSWTKISLSMKCFKYDALFKIDKEKYRQYIIDDIKNIYSKMLDCGTTTVWETEKGESDFDNAGSLCHGWSAMPVYYFHKLLVKEKDI